MVDYLFWTIYWIIFGFFLVYGFYNLYKLHLLNQEIRRHREAIEAIIARRRERREHVAIPLPLPWRENTSIRESVGFDWRKEGF